MKTTIFLQREHGLVTRLLTLYEVATINKNTSVIMPKRRKPEGLTVTRNMGIDSAMIAAKNRIFTGYNKEKK